MSAPEIVPREVMFPFTSSAPVMLALPEMLKREPEMVPMTSSFALDAAVPIPTLPENNESVALIRAVVVVQSSMRIVGRPVDASLVSIYQF